MFIATALTLRGENNILSSKSAGSGASDCKTASRHLPAGQAQWNRGRTLGINIRRPALVISRIVSRSLFDVPVNNVGPVSARGS
jgi:hypothetical protein